MASRIKARELRGRLHICLMEVHELIGVRNISLKPSLTSAYKPSHCRQIQRLDLCDFRLARIPSGTNVVKRGLRQLCDIFLTHANFF